MEVKDGGGGKEEKERAEEERIKKGTRKVVGFCFVCSQAIVMLSILIVWCKK